MFQGHKQVYTSTLGQLKAAMLDRKVKSMLIDEGTFKNENGPALDILHAVLGNAWTHAAQKPISEPGNYMCVLRNNHVVHVQALPMLHENSPDTLLLTTPMYPAGLEQITLEQCNTMPPEDEDLWFHINNAGEVNPFRGVSKGWDDNDPPPSYFRLQLLAGPHVDCRTPMITRPKFVAPGVDFTAIMDRMVNEQAEADSQVVWYRAITAPPHYTQAMIQKDTA